MTGQCPNCGYQGKKALKSVSVDSFNRFWLNYPRKTGKGAAERVWLKLRPADDLLIRILNSLEDHKRSDAWKQSNGQYIPHPSTWLHQKRWEDEVILNRAKEDPEKDKKMADRKAELERLKEVEWNKRHETKDSNACV